MIQHGTQLGDGGSNNRVLSTYGIGSSFEATTLPSMSTIHRLATPQNRLMEAFESMAGIPTNEGAVPVQRRMDTNWFLMQKSSSGLSKMMGTHTYQPRTCHLWKKKAFCVWEMLNQTHAFLKVVSWGKWNF